MFLDLSLSPKSGLSQIIEPYQSIHSKIQLKMNIMETNPKLQLKKH